MISRGDMLELTKRTTLSRTSFIRIAEYYVDRDGDFEGSSNTDLLKLSAPEKAKKLKPAKEVPFSPTDVNLKKYEFREGAQKPGSMWQLLMAMNECGLENDALMDTFCDAIMENYKTNSACAILVFHGHYNISVRTSDRERLWEPKEVFEYMICAVCLMVGGYEPAKPECSFSFLVFTDRGRDLDHIAVFQAEADRSHGELLEILGIG